MADKFSKLTKGREYSRKMLAALWGYASYHAIARGVVTPSNDRYIILFVTEEKQESSVQYKDRLEAGRLRWEGPEDHFAEERMSAASSQDEIHVFYRRRHHMDFTYLGRMVVIAHRAHSTRPSEFTLECV
jgi:hypothetical protein